MSERTVIVCDECKVESDREHLEWFRVELLGLDTTAFEQSTLPADFCSVACAVRYLANCGVRQTDMPAVGG